MTKTSIILLVTSSLLLFYSCSNNNSAITKEKIVGLWKNMKTVNSEIEFTQSGQYFLWIKGDKLEYPTNYIIDSKCEDYNLIIYDDSVNEVNSLLGKIELSGSNNMTIIVYNKKNKKILMKSDFVRYSK